MAANKYNHKEVAWDDIIDALVLAVTAKLGHGRLHSLPTKPERDLFDLPMEIVVAE